MVSYPPKSDFWNGLQQIVNKCLILKTDEQ